MAGWPEQLVSSPGPFTVYALRQDGFTQEIQVTLEGAPAGFTVRGGVIRAGQDQTEMNLLAPALVSLRTGGTLLSRTRIAV